MKKYILTAVFLCLFLIQPTMAIRETGVEACTEEEGAAYEALATPYGNEFSMLLDERLSMVSAAQIPDWAIEYEDFYRRWQHVALVDSPNCAGAVRLNNFLDRFFTEIYTSSLLLYVGFTEEALGRNGGVVLRSLSDEHVTRANALFDHMEFSFEVDSDLNTPINSCAEADLQTLHNNLYAFSTDFDYINSEEILPPEFAEMIDETSVGAIVIELNDLQTAWWDIYGIEETHCQESLEAMSVYGSLIDGTMIYTLMRQMYSNRSQLIDTTGESLNAVMVDIESQIIHNGEVAFVRDLRDEVDELLDYLAAR